MIESKFQAHYIKSVIGIVNLYNNIKSVAPEIYWDVLNFEVIPIEIVFYKILSKSIVLNINFEKNEENLTIKFNLNDLQNNFKVLDKNIEISLNENELYLENLKLIFSELRNNILEIFEIKLIQ